MTNNASPLHPTRGGARYDYLDTPRPVFTEGKNGMPALMPAQGAFNSLWADAVAEYEKQTYRRIDSDESFRDFENLGDLEHAIEGGKERFGAFRSEHHRVYSALKKCIAPMEPFLDIVQKGIGGTPYAPASAVFGAASYLLQACATVSKSYDGVEELFWQMSDITQRLKVYESENIESSLSKKMEDILALFLEIMGKTEAAIKRKRLGQGVKTVFLKDDAISPLVAKLRKYVEAELGLVTALTYGRVKDIQEVAADTHNDVRIALATLRNDSERAKSDADEKKLYDALHTDTVDEVTREHAGSCDKLTKGTAAWIRDDAMFQAWEQEKAPCLWVFGKPGVGKTMLAARTIETLQSKYPQHSDIPSLTSVSYLYIKDDNPKLQDCAQMWKTAAWQIARANDRFKKHVLATIQKKQDTFVSARRIWQQLFLDFFQEDVSSQSSTSLAFIVIDGLDEAPQPERVKLLKCLAELVNRGPNLRKCRIQVAVFARPNVRADPGFDKVSFRMQERLIEVTPARNTMDIDLYIKHRLGDIFVLQALKKREATKEYRRLAKQIYNSVQSKSQGMFLWARLVFDQIRASPSPEAIEVSLQKAPEGLDEMLYHVFKRLEVYEEMRRSYLKDLLTWVFCAYRPLYVSELFVLIMISAHQHCYLIEDDLRTRYSSVFDVTGPYIQSERDQQQLETDVDEISSSDPDFGFLDIDDSSHDEEAGDGSDHSNRDFNEHESQVEDTDVTSQKEKEGVSAILPHWRENTVTFSHARVRDYLKTEGDPSTRRPDQSLVVPNDLNKARLAIYDACLQLLETKLADTYDVQALKFYAKINWIKHLVEIDFSKIPREDAVRSARRLSALFIGGQGLLQTSFGALNEFIETWFTVSKYSNSVRKIIGDYAEDVDDDQREWALTAAKSARTLFQPLMVACARIWLAKEGWDDPAYLKKSEREVCIMYACSTLADDGSIEGSVDIRNYDYGFRNIPLDVLVSLANAQPVPKSAHYYTGLAWIMMEAEEEPYTDRAIEYFKKALDLLPGGWVAMEGIARCYGDNRSEHETAIHWMEDAIRNLPQTDGLTGTQFYLETRISDWKLQLGDDQGALEIAHTSYEASKGFTYGNQTASDSSILRSIKHYIEALYRRGQYDEMTELLYDLDTRETLEPHTSLWIIFLRKQIEECFAVDLFNKLGKVTQESKDNSLHELMRKSIKTAIELNADTVVDFPPIWLAYQLAQWQYRYAPDSQESIEVWQEIVTLVDQSNENVQQSQNWFRSTAAMYLSLIFFNTAMANFNTGKDSSTKISKIEDLAKHTQGSKRYYRASYPAQILGLWLHEYVKAGEEDWRACIRPSVKQALYLLTDDDPWNDQEAYTQLGGALLAAGDVLNGSIAYGMTLKPLDDPQKELKQRENKQDVREHHYSQKEAIPDGVQAEVEQDERKEENIPKKKITDTDTSESLEKDIGEPEETTRYPAQEVDETDEEHLAGPNDNRDNDNDNQIYKEEDDESDESAQSFNPKYADLCNWSCDGPCNTPRSDYAELWICRVCPDSCFCEKCIDLHKREGIDARICAVEHPLVRIYPLTDKAREVIEALMEKKFEAQQEWLNSLRKDWED